MNDDGKYRAIVCGGRRFSDVPLIWRTLDEIDQTWGNPALRCVIDGASDASNGPYVGADYWAHQWALSRGRTTIRVPAKWDAYGRAAGPIRNGDMLAGHGANLVIAFPGGNGTRDMIARAELAGVEVIKVRVSG
jgi:hypothetical protein